jgi:hypothetical protein
MTLEMEMNKQGTKEATTVTHNHHRKHSPRKKSSDHTVVADRTEAVWCSLWVYSTISFNDLNNSQKGLRASPHTYDRSYIGGREWEDRGLRL